MISSSPSCVASLLLCSLWTSSPISGRRSRNGSRNRPEIRPSSSAYRSSTRAPASRSPKEVEQSVFDRMRAERQRESALVRAEGEEQGNIIRAQADRSRTVTVAEGEQRRSNCGARVKPKQFASMRKRWRRIRSSTRFPATEAYGTILKTGDRLVIPRQRVLTLFARSKSRAQGVTAYPWAAKGTVVDTLQKRPSGWGVRHDLSHRTATEGPLCRPGPGDRHCVGRMRRIARHAGSALCHRGHRASLEAVTPSSTPTPAPPAATATPQPTALASPTAPPVGGSHRCAPAVEHRGPAHRAAAIAVCDAAGHRCSAGVRSAPPLRPRRHRQHPPRDRHHRRRRRPSFGYNGAWFTGDGGASYGGGCHWAPPGHNIAYITPELPLAGSYEIYAWGCGDPNHDQAYLTTVMVYPFSRGFYAAADGRQPEGGRGPLGIPRHLPHGAGRIAERGHLGHRQRGRGRVPLRLPLRRAPGHHPTPAPTRTTWTNHPPSPQEQLTSGDLSARLGPRAVALPVHARAVRGGDLRATARHFRDDAARSRTGWRVLVGYRGREPFSVAYRLSGRPAPREPRRAGTACASAAALPLRPQGGVAVLRLSLSRRLVALRQHQPAG